MSNEPSPLSGTPVQRAIGSATASIEHSPHSQPSASGTTLLPTRSIPNAPLDGPAAVASFVPAWRRPTNNIDGGSEAVRRPSVQFVPSKSTSGSRSSSANPPSVRRSTGAHASRTTAQLPAGRRLSSPPPPAQFRPSVSFDTFSNPAASDFSLTLNRKHRDYEYTKRSRTFLCGTDTNDYSDTALEWLIDELVDDGDEVVCLRVVEKDSKEASTWSRGQGKAGYRKEAERFLEEIEKKNTDDRAISLVLEFSIGGVQDTIQKMIRIYEPAMLVVGTRGRSLTGYQGLLSSGSVSKYCLQYSPVPVIVVRPSRKREAKKKKRLEDPSRQSYRDILDKSDDAPPGRGTHLLDEKNRLSIMGSELGALGRLDVHDDEARRVAEAIGYRPVANIGEPHEPTGGSSSLSRLSSTRSENSTADDVRSPPTRIMKSPSLGIMESPVNSDEEGEFDDEEELTPAAEAMRIARETAMQIRDEVKEDQEERAKRGRSRSRPDDGEESSGGGGAAILDIFEKLNKGLKN